MTLADPLASQPYAPAEEMRVLRQVHVAHGTRLSTDYGNDDAFCERRGWFAQTFMAIDQGPIVTMIANYRNGFIWRRMRGSAPIVAGLRKAGFTGGWLRA